MRVSEQFRDSKAWRTITDFLFTLIFAFSFLARLILQGDYTLLTTRPSVF